MPQKIYNDATHIPPPIMASTHHTKLIPRSEIPEDCLYYRTSSPVYQEYLERYNSIYTMQVTSGQYGWKKDLFGKHAGLVKYDRIDTEPDTEFLRGHGLQHGMIIWVPYRRTEIPEGWRSLWLSTHFTRTGFTVLDRGDEYYKKWNERARRARKKFLAQPDSIRIELVTPAVFIEAFRRVKIKHPYKSDYIRYYDSMSSIDPSSIRSYVCYLDDRPISGLAVHDYGGNSSVHLVAFTTQEAGPCQAGTGLIDRWFSDSLAQEVKYMSFDHLRDSVMMRDQQGYTDFKLNFIDYEVRFPDSYFRFV